jgi:GDP-mannose 6-dehydrogenase
MANGISPVKEPKVDELLSVGVANGSVTATTDAEKAIRQSQISLVCVGTPSKASGDLNLAYVENLTDSMASVLAKLDRKHTLIYRSTMLPGSTRKIASERLGNLVESRSLDVFFFPEFLREGTAVDDFNNPGLSVIGVMGEPSTEAVPTILHPLLGKNWEASSLEVAEMLKYSCNAFHALKVTFANEIGRISKQSGIDSRSVMRMLCKDEILNISTAYLRPGTPFGGSCLPKDLSALGAFSRSSGIPTPCMDSLTISNGHHLTHLERLVEKAGNNRVVIVGVAFKDDTDDLRGSSFVILAASLIMGGYDVRLIDPLVEPQSLTGANEVFARMKLPVLDELLTDSLDDILDQPATIVVTKKCLPLDDFIRSLAPQHHVIDVNNWPELANLAASYEGICWER